MKRKVKIVSFLVALLLFPMFLMARHIVGGEITYRFLRREGNNNIYSFTLHIYRDCTPSTTAPFDPNALIGVFLGTNPRPERTISVPLKSSKRINAPDLPCFDEPDPCVDEAIYTWEASLEIRDELYTLTYQRCCRNRTINNILSPDNTGVTYTVEITPDAQRLGNSSPTFKNLPPTVICANEPLNFDHSVVDEEGDVMVYRFCQPLAGGAFNDPRRGCYANIPNPPCYPPPQIVAFKAPEYSFDNPLGGEPRVRINSRTGIITGTPNVLGQFVVGICIEEYRGGRLLSVLRRDFQFNVETCKPLVRAAIEADSVRDKTYYITRCGEKVVPIKNLSVDRAFINNFRFEINLIGESNTTFSEWEPVVTFPDTGSYNGRLYLNPGAQPCNDTINLKFNIYDEFNANFQALYDTCRGGVLTLNDRSSSPNGAVVNWNWDINGEKTANTRNTTHTFQRPGDKNIRLRVRDAKGCRAEANNLVRWFPVPELPIVQPSTFDGCSPAKITFNNLSQPIDSTYNIRWTFGDGNTSNAISPTHIYSTPGTYSVSIGIVSPTGCRANRTFSDFIRVRQGAKADFSFTPERVNRFNNVVSFQDKSTFTTGWQWFANERFFSTRPSPTYTFRDTGAYDIKLLVRNQFNCTDSLVKRVDVEPLLTYWLPNAFTPNGDGSNDEYRGRGVLDDLDVFTMRIWNRWGELIFQTNNPTEGWNGRKYNNGDPSQQGVYLCIVNYTSRRGEAFEIKSYATLLR